MEVNDENFYRYYLIYLHLKDRIGLLSKNIKMNYNLLIYYIY